MRNIAEAVALLLSGTDLVHYDAMCRAIAEAYAVDEVKEIRDRAIAIEVYARQAHNTEAETRACQIRLRAERRCGQLLREMEKAKGSPGNQHTGPLPAREGSKPLAELGMSHNQSSRWQKLAAIPEADFEATFAGDTRPSTSGLIAAHEPKKPPVVIPVHPHALWVWGRLLDFEREGVLEADPNALFGTMLPHMKETVCELVPRVVKWLERLMAASCMRSSGISMRRTGNTLRSVRTGWRMR